MFFYEFFLFFIFSIPEPCTFCFMRYVVPEGPGELMKGRGFMSWWWHGLWHFFYDSILPVI
jgi:hypothetical protein